MFLFSFPSAKINDTVNFGEEEEDDNIEFDEVSGDEDIEGVCQRPLNSHFSFCSFPSYLYKADITRKSLNEHPPVVKK